MQWIFVFCFALCVFNVSKTLSTTTVSRINFYEKAQNENFNIDELELLKPILDNLQTQYDEIYAKANENVNSNTDVNDSHLKDLLLAVLEQFADEDTTIFKYDINLLTINDLKGSLNQGIPSDEAQDMENILQENIDDATHIINSLIDQSNETEAMLISIDQIKIFKFIYKILGNIFSIAIKVARAAYCTYSYIPIINSTITEGRTNVGSCYFRSRNSIRHLRTEVQTSINQIGGNVIELVNIYKKFSNRKSLLGKLFTVLMNVSKITNDITNSRSTASKAIEEVKTETPKLIASSEECATIAIPNLIQQLNETITGLTTCINFIDDSTVGPEPEPESSEEDSEEVDLKTFAKKIINSNELRH